MNQEEIIAWTKKNEKLFGSKYEKLFAENVLPLINGISLQDINIQFPFKDIMGNQRYCDFLLRRNDLNIAIEIDGYDKRGTGTGMTHDEFVDWQRRHGSLSSMGWYVIRFANRDVRDHPKLCASMLNGLIENTKNKSSQLYQDINTSRTASPADITATGNPSNTRNQGTTTVQQKERKKPWYHLGWIPSISIAIAIYSVFFHKPAIENKKPTADNIEALCKNINTKKNTSSHKAHKQ